MPVPVATRAAADTVDAPAALDPALQRLLDALPKEDDARLECAACQSAITSPAERIEVSGAHTHHFTNPHGIRFHVGCFASAPGCAVFGAREFADTWFPGHTWRLAACQACGEHLGWYFEGPSDLGAFFGLIVDRLRERSAH